MPPRAKSVHPEAQSCAEGIAGSEGQLASWEAGTRRATGGRHRAVGHVLRASLLLVCMQPVAAGWTLTCGDGSTTYEQGSDLLGDLKAIVDGTSEAGVDCCFKFTDPPLAALPLPLQRGHIFIQSRHLNAHLSFCLLPALHLLFSGSLLCHLLEGCKDHVTKRGIKRGVNDTLAPHLSLIWWDLLE